MIAQPLLALADRIGEAQGRLIAIDPQASLELRRLVEVNAELLDALNVMVKNFGPTPSDEVTGLGKARAAITKAEATK